MSNRNQEEFDDEFRGITLGIQPSTIENRLDGYTLVNPTKEELSNRTPDEELIDKITAYRFLLENAILENNRYAIELYENELKKFEEEYKRNFGSNN